METFLRVGNVSYWNSWGGWLDNTLFRRGNVAALFFFFIQERISSWTTNEGFNSGVPFPHPEEAEVDGRIITSRRERNCNLKWEKETDVSDSEQLRCVSWENVAGAGLSRVPNLTPSINESLTVGNVAPVTSFSLLLLASRSLPYWLLRRMRKKTPRIIRIYWITEENNNNSNFDFTIDVKFN